LRVCLPISDAVSAASGKIAASSMPHRQCRIVRDLSRYVVAVGQIDGKPQPMLSQSMLSQSMLSQSMLSQPRNEKGAPFGAPVPVSSSA
jgi:hypothetical protein